MRDLANRLRNAVTRVTVKSIADQTIQSAELVALDGDEMSEVERLQNYGLNSWPDDGAQGLMANVGGSRDLAVILSADFPKERKLVEKGEVAVYSKYNNYVHLKSDESIEVMASKIAIKNGSDDLISLMVDLLTALESVTVNTAMGPQPFVNLADFSALKSKIEAFKE